LSSRRGSGDATWLACAAARLLRREKSRSVAQSARSVAQRSVSMPTISGPTGRRHRVPAPTPSIKRCLNATVQAADRLDDWIRRYVVEHPLRYRPTEFCAHQSQPAEGQKPFPPFSGVSASHYANQSPVNRRPRNRQVLVRERCAWLSAIGNSLRAGYDAAAAPVPPHIAALIDQLDTQK
jgi:hypothetical protein